MSEMLRAISGVSIIVFAVSSMLAMGFSFTYREIVAPLRETSRVARALLGNFILVPLLAAAIVYAFALDPAVGFGFFLLGTAAGAPFMVKLVTTAEGDVRLGTALLVLLVPVTVIFMPIALPLLAPDAAVASASVAGLLALTLLLPLVIGLLVREKAHAGADRLLPAVRVVSTVTLALLVATTLLANLRELGDLLASRALFAMLLFVVGSFAIGYGIASPHPARRAVLGLGTAQRNIAAATVVAAAVRGTETLVLVVVASVLALFVLFPVARWLRGWMRMVSADTLEPQLAGSRT